MNLFSLSATPFEVNELKQSLHNPRAGALVTFEGWVRNHNDGRGVVMLEYESYEEMATKEGSEILEETKARFDILDARCIHRVGKLEIGEMAIWIGVTAAHRADALRACEHIINQVKARVPIWKKEYYADGDTGWVNCNDRCTMPAPAD